MPRVLLAGFCAIPDAERAGVQIPHVLRALAEQYAVEVLAVRDGDRAYVENYRKTRLLRVPVPRGSLRERIDSYRRALRRQLEGAEYSAVHCCDPWSAVPALELRERLGFQVVYDVARRPHLALGDELLVRECRRDEDRSLREADLVLAPTESSIRYLVARSARAVRLVPPGVDVDTFDWDHREADQPAEVLYAGPLGPGRGLEVLLRAMVDVCARTGARLRLLGNMAPGYHDELVSDIEARGMSNRVSISPAVDNEDMPREIARAAVCVAPRAEELSRHPDAVYPTKLLEFMACQRVVVAPRRGTVTSLLHDGEHALLFSPDDASELAAQILRLLGDPSLAARLALAGYHLVRQHHTASATRRAVRDAYREIEPEMPEFDTDPQLAAHPAEAHPVTHDITDSQLSAETASGVIETGDDTDAIAALTVVTEAAGLSVTGTSTRVDADTVRGDAWVVESGPLRDDTHRHRRPRTEEGLPPPAGPASADLADTGTRVEVAAVEDAFDSDPVGNRFAAGELETRTPAEGTVSPAESTVFTAVGPFLSGNQADESNEAEAAGDDTEN